MLALAWLAACTGWCGRGGLVDLTLLPLIFWNVVLVVMFRIVWMAGPASEEWVARVKSGALCANPDAWTDGSLVRDEVSGVCCGGGGVFAVASASSWFRRSWGHLELLPPDRDRGTERSWLYFSVPRPLQTAQRAALWRVIAALEASKPVSSWSG